MTQKTNRNNERIVLCDDILDALYPQPPAELWLELRCIHPETSAVRPLWTQIGNKKQRRSVLSGTDQLNHKGFGVYFAPCLRHEKKGNVVSAALLPALLVDVDCDGNPNKCKKGLVRLREFDPTPSIIVNSGGGWHGYWLLDEPSMLGDDQQNQRISRTMHGLFSALCGDESYVKSVASVMRLPGSTNTKPNRDDSPVQVDWYPDLRYPFPCFEWLEAQLPPKGERISGLDVVTPNGNRHAPLPPRTE